MVASIYMIFSVAQTFLLTISIPLKLAVSRTLCRVFSTLGFLCRQLDRGPYSILEAVLTALSSHD